MIRIFANETSFDFLNKRKIAYAFSLVITLISLWSIYANSLNFGIDFSGGLLLEVKSIEGKADISALRENLGKLGMGDMALQSIGEDGTEVIIRAQISEDEAAQAKQLETIREALGSKYEERRVEMVGPQVGAELINDGIMAVVIAVVGITLYIWFRFEFPFALGAMISLVHDVLSTVGIYSLLQIDFSLTTVAAILTLAGYSINDTVVNYDRVRENLRKYKKMPVVDLLNKSVNEMLARTFLTSGTTLLTVVALFVLGGDALKSFSFALLWGIIFGTYSSVYIAMAILLFFDLRKVTAPVGPYEKTEEKEE